MQDFIATVMAPEFLATLFAAICALATILTFGLPFLEQDRVNQRMRVMAVERDKLRAERLKDMAVQERTGGGKLRQAPKGFILRIVDQLNLREKFDNEVLRGRLKSAGFRSEAHLATYMAYRVICPPALFVLSMVYMLLIARLDMSLILMILVASALAFFGFYFPNIFIENKIGKRRTAIEQAFPDALDMLLICVQAGMSVEAAFAKVAREVTVQSIELAEELSLTTAELSYLPDRRMAYENLSKRTGLEGVKSVCTALIQAERYGTPVGQALRVMAKENRELRLSKAEQKAAALPPKLTVPMIAFFIPVLFLAILGPAVITVMKLQ